MANFQIMTKPMGPICNLDCTYCYYLEKENLYGDKKNFKMTDDVLESYIRQYIQSQSSSTVSFAWQGGEPTLLGVPFFERVIQLQAKYCGGKRIENAFQTNGTLLDDQWGEFLAAQQLSDRHFDRRAGGDSRRLSRGQGRTADARQGDARA